MSGPLKIAAVGVGRIGIYHALHVQELANREGTCELSAIVDGHEDLAERVVAQLQPGQEGEIRTFTSVDELARAGAADAAVIASRTADHFLDARTLIDAGQRVLLEKPLTHSLETSREFVAWLDGDERRRQALMLAFMRRFDAPLRRAGELLAEERIGKVFKIVSILEDPHGPPEGYSSPGLLSDMAVHNADEVIWLTGKMPRSVTGMGARLHNQKVSSVVEDFDDQKVSSVVEDFDDAFIQMWLEEDVIAQVQVSRNHVACYRNETCIYGDEGVIQVGALPGEPARGAVRGLRPRQRHRQAGVPDARLRPRGAGVHRALRPGVFSRDRPLRRAVPERRAVQRRPAGRAAGAAGGRRREAFPAGSRGRGRDRLR